ncbi:S8 family serine peptidase [Rhodopseudomonas pseudopalustris]|uniref:Subtilase family protein n=1 Tax=Rhodopseudomonas pseudopalustris TaxID=1513892 RepID=A0A1H8TNI9_9BRAD|nr:S8 family serine peptidase [Rhodopseudomonas pseudopalustris]SEO92532.1 Subtilase family protein [Rhodopseudomonas pseudopalustris]
MVRVAGADFQKEVLFALGGGDSQINIAVLDGPVDRTHDCFRGARLVPLDTAAAEGSDGRATAQGTHIASLIFGQPCSSVEGVAPLCRGLIAPIFSDDRLDCSQAELAQAITIALDHGAHIIQISGGLFGGPRQPTAELLDAVARCNADNALIVAGAGRDGCGSLLRRCGATNLLPVGAIDQHGRLIDGGDASLHEIGIAVPGANLIGAAPQGGIDSRRGANYAAALIAGIAGLLLGTQRQTGRTLDPGAAVEAMLSTATPRVAARAYECHRAWIGLANVEAAAVRLNDGMYDTATGTPFQLWHRAQTSAKWSDHAAFRPRA